LRRLAILTVLAGCFGEGPTPESARDAKVLFALPLQPLVADEDCVNVPYIGNVALGEEHGYVATYAFLPACGNGTGNPETKIAATVYEFDKRGGPTRSLGDAGMTQEGGGPRPRIGARGADVVWIFGEQALKMRLPDEMVTVATAWPSGSGQAATMLVDDGRTYVAGWNGFAGPYHDLDPTYPCCGGGNNNPSSDNLFVFTHASPPVVTTLHGSPMFFGEQVKDPLVMNGDTLFFLQRMGGGVAITALPKAGGPTTMVATVDGGSIPSGLAASATHVAWGTTNDFRITPTDVDACSISVVRVPVPGTPEELLRTSAFSCMDVALDVDHVYFTIVDVVDGDGSDLVRNRGVGRVNLTTGELETLALGITSPHVGPRQVFVDGDGLVLVAPFAVARIAKDALAGRHDLE
jgi:hypothetical protein